MKLSPTLRADVVGGFLAFLLTFGAVIVVVAPKLLTSGQTHAQQQAELESRRRQAAELDQNIVAMRKNIEMLQTQYNAAVKLSSASRVNSRMSELAAHADECAITLARISPGNPGPAASPLPASAASSSTARGKVPDVKTTVVPITLMGNGTYPDICRYVHLLHDLFRDTALSSIKINGQPDPASSEKPIATFTVDLAWYAAPAASADASPNP